MRLRSAATWLLLAIGAIVVFFGVTDMLNGLNADPAITESFSGSTPDELRARDPAAFDLADGLTRAGGLHLVVMGLTWLALVWFGVRRGLGWAWMTTWTMPLWSASVAVAFLLAPRAAPEVIAPPMISGPILAVIAAAALLLTRPRATAAS